MLGHGPGKANSFCGSAPEFLAAQSPAKGNAKYRRKLVPLILTRRRE
jgi:hypothetical protein